MIERLGRQLLEPEHLVQRIVDTASDTEPQARDANANTAAASAPGCRDPQTYAPMWAILSSQHESQYSRLFRS